VNGDAARFVEAEDSEQHELFEFAEIAGVWETREFSAGHALFHHIMVK
jgi:hypothetical protein